MDFRGLSAPMSQVRVSRFSIVILEKDVAFQYEVLFANEGE